MTPTELHTLVRGWWEEMRDTARAATPGPWAVFDANEGTSSPAGWMVANDAFHNPSGDDAPWIAVEIHTGGVEDADHIAAFDPSFAIAACEAALERLDRHKPLMADTRRPRCWYSGDEWRWPCVEFLSDAAPFRTRPDFPEELSRDRT